MSSRRWFIPQGGAQGASKDGKLLLDAGVDNSEIGFNEAPVRTDLVIRKYTDLPKT